MFLSKVDRKVKVILTKFFCLGKFTYELNSSLCEFSRTRYCLNSLVFKGQCESCRVKFSQKEKIYKNLDS